MKFSTYVCAGVVLSLAICAPEQFPHDLSLGLVFVIVMDSLIASIRELAEK